MRTPNAALEPTAITKELQRVVSSAELARSEQLKRFLAFIVEESLAGRAGKIKEYTVALAVLGRDDAFDPTIDPVVRIQAGRLRRALERYYLVEGKNNPVRIEIPKGGYRPTFHRVVAAPIELDTEASQGGPEEQDPTSVLSSGPTIAVLHFANLSGDPEHEHFAAGLTEELIVQLTRLQELVVITHQSTHRYKDQHPDPRRVGSDLGARFLLEGSVRKDANAIRVSVQLEETTNGECLWAESYDRELAVGSMFELQDDITRNVAAMIGDAYGLIPRTLCKESRGKPVEDLSVYEATLRFYEYGFVGGRDAHAAAHSALEQAVELDPEYSLIWALLGESHADAYIHGFTTVKNPLEQASACARRAVALDPMCQNARWSRAFSYFLSHDKDRFLREVAEVINLNPNSAYMMILAGVSMALSGEWDRGLRILDRVIHLNPYHPGWSHLAPYLNHYRHKRYEEALATAEKINLPESVLDPALRAATMSQLGQKKLARETLEKALGLNPDFKKNPKRYLSRLIYSDELVSHVMEGLVKAGLRSQT